MTRDACVFGEIERKAWSLLSGEKAGQRVKVRAAKDVAVVRRTGK